MVGLPESGKTTFLAALWHVVNDSAANTGLRFSKLLSDDVAYLNEITRVWRSATKQEHTKAGSAHVVSMNLVDSGKSQLTLTFPDISGESFQGMWERRECDASLAEMLTGATAILFFIHADRIKEPIWKSDINDLVELVRNVEACAPAPAPAPDHAGDSAEPKEAKQVAREWEPIDAPTQVQVVELLQFLVCRPFGAKLRRVAIVLSAWDIAKQEKLAPGPFLARAMPLVHQYINNADLEYQWKLFGVSAQGGDFGRAEDVERLRGLGDPSTWIEVQTDDDTAKDLTIPLSWLRSGG